MNVLETEYKFLVNKIPKKNCKKKKIIQVYFEKQNVINELKTLLNLNPPTFNKIESVRLRVVSSFNRKDYYFTAKTKGQLGRYEYEKQIDKNTVLKLLQKQKIGIIKKNRYTITKDNFIFEFDEYQAKHLGLKTCEIEVQKTTKNEYDQIKNILTTSFNLIIKDVTKNNQFKNYFLAKENFYENN